MLSDDESSKNIGWKFISANGSWSYSDPDGSYGYVNEDGSGYYSGADGSYGSRDADGNGYFSGADGSYGNRNSDGSGYYNGADGSWGSIDSNGYGFLNNADGSTDYSSLDNSNIDSSNDAQASAIGALGAAAVMGFMAYHEWKSKKEQEEKEEAERIEAEQIRLRQEKAEKRRQENAIRKKKFKAMLLDKGKVQFDYGSDDLIGENYQYALDIFKENGFKKIKLNPIKDVYITNEQKVNKVEKISIGNISQFQKGDMIPYFNEVIITYHVKREIQIPFSADKCKRENYIEVENELKQLGFTEIYECPLFDLVTGWINKDGSVDKVLIGGEKFRKNSVYLYDRRIEIYYHSYKRN